MFRCLYPNKIVTAIKFKYRSLSKQTFDDHVNFRLIINHLVREIEEDPKYLNIIKYKHIELNVWPIFLNSFRRNLIKRPQTYIESKGFNQLCSKLNEIEKIWTADNDNSKERESSMSNCKDYLFNLIVEKAEVDMKEMIDACKSLSTTVDLKKPYNWYPMTRLMKRNIIYHGGPTNSGKTYHALKRLKEADVSKGGGLYCGPLRLLALEIYEQLNTQGIYTNLITGQEKKEIPGATHISSTIEVVSLTKEYDIAVIDEIQMISDKERGYAWTRALLGLKAREIHLCGGLEAEQVVRSLMESTGDNFTLQKYERLSTLHIEEKSLRGDYTKVMPGDCIVAFTKADIFSIRKQIEAKTKYKCAVIYGQLPPETRSTQARLFNEEGSEYDILVASDAIGMGLNLNIRRIIFHTTLKSSRNTTYWVEPTSIKQIAGRAGRLSSKYKTGLVTAWQEVDLAYVRSIMQWDIPQIQSAGISPSIEQIESFNEQLEKVNKAKIESEFQEEYEIDADNELDTTITDKTYIVTTPTTPTTAGTNNDNNIIANNTSDQLNNKQTINVYAPNETNKYNIRLSSVMSQFLKLSQIDPRFHMCAYNDVETIANWLHTIPLSIEDRYVFANCPININDAYSMHKLYHYVSSYALKRPVAINIRLSESIPKNFESFGDLCIKHNMLDLYLWLSIRFPEYFIERELCLEQKSYAIKQIEESLSSSTFFETSNYKQAYLFKRSRFGCNLLKSVYGEYIHDEFNKNLSKIPKDLYYII